MIIEIIFKWYFIDFFTLYFDPVPNFQWIFIEILTHNKLSFNEYIPYNLILIKISIMWFQQIFINFS